MVKRAAEWRRSKCSTRLSNQTVPQTRMRSRRIATARHCRRDRACVYPAIRDGSRASTLAPPIERVESLSVTLRWPSMHFGHPRLGPRRASTASACTTGCVNARPFGVMQRIFQAAAWLLAGIIVVLSLGPASVRPTTGAPHDLEHLLIFLATGMAFGFGYPDRFRLLTIALPTFAAAIEVAQIWVPGRHARMSDFLVDAAASCLGVGLSYAFVRLKAAVIRR